MIIRPTLTELQARSWRPTLSGASDDDILAWYHAVIPEFGPDAQLVEVGVWKGRSLLFAAELLAAHGRTGSRIYGVDEWVYPVAGDDPEWLPVTYHDVLDDLVAHSSAGELDLIHLVRVHSLAAARLFQPGQLDVVMIDADHRYPAVRADICAWRSRLRRGGLLAGHDYGLQWPGVMQAVDELVGRRTRHHGTVWWCEV